MKRRFSFSKLKTFLNTKFWLFNLANNLSISDLGRQLVLSFEKKIKRFDNFNFKNNQRFRNINFKRIIKNFKGNSVISSLNPAASLRLSSFLRFLRADKIARKYWWRLARKFKPFPSYRRRAKVFRLNSFWRYPYTQNKMSALARQSLKLRLLKLTRRRGRFIYLPKHLTKRIKVYYFLNKGFWRFLDNLIRVRVRFTLNNLFVTLTTKAGKNLVSFSSGGLGFKGTTKLTSYAIEKVAMHVSKFLKKRRFRNLYLIFNSGAIGFRSKVFLETLVYNSLIVKYLTISDAIPHNGVRPRKTKRR